MYYRINGRDEGKRYKYKYMTVEQYLKRKCDGYDISDVFVRNNYKIVAIYGTGELGACLCKDLENSSVRTECFIDGNTGRFPDETFMGYTVLPVSEVKQKCRADIIVITDLYDCNSIIDSLLKHGWALEKIMSLSEVVY